LKKNLIYSEYLGLYQEDICTYDSLSFSPFSFSFYFFLLSSSSVQLLNGLGGESKCIFISFSSPKDVETRNVFKKDKRRRIEKRRKYNTRLSTCS